MVYQFNADDLYFFLGGKSYDFFALPSWTEVQEESSKKDFLERNQKKGYLNADGTPIDLLQQLFRSIEVCQYCLVRPNSGIIGPQYMDAFFISETGAVLARSTFQGKYKLEALDSAEALEFALRKVFSLNRIITYQGTPQHIDLPSEEAETLLTAQENRDMKVIAQFAERFSLQPEELLALLQHIVNNQIHIEVHRMTKTPGGIALGIRADKAAAVRMIASPSGNMTCFETVHFERAKDYILDFKGK